jgi:hypothetical protein
MNSNMRLKEISGAFLEGVRDKVRIWVVLAGVRTIL